MNAGRWTLPLLLGVATGVGVGWLVGRNSTVRRVEERVAPTEGAAERGSEERAPDHRPPPPTSPSSPGRGREPQSEGDPSPAPSEAARAPLRSERNGEVPLLHDGLLEHARNGIRRGWAEVRSDPVPADALQEGLDSFERTVLESPWRIGRNLAEREEQREALARDAAAGGAMVLLGRLLEDPQPMLELVSDDAAFAALFQRQAPERGLDALTVIGRERPEEELEDGVTLDFPAGVFRLDPRGIQNRRPFPRDVTIAGAGRDATLLVLGTDFSMRGELRNFTLRDCTVDTDGHYLFDLRSAPATLQAHRVRLLGFDSGAGQSVVFRAPSAAILARDCIIAGGYGRSPGSGSLLGFRRGAVMARFEGCRIELVQLFTGHPGTAVFVNCALRDVLDGEGDFGPWVAFPGSTVVAFDPNGPEPGRRDLDALFPAWRQRLGR